jgi:hypothetical protein
MGQVVGRQNGVFLTGQHQHFVAVQVKADQ